MMSPIYDAHNHKYYSLQEQRFDLRMYHCILSKQSLYTHTHTGKTHHFQITGNI